MVEWCYSWDLKCPLKVHVIKVWSLAWCYWDCGIFKGWLNGQCLGYWGACLKGDSGTPL
jgi:hypothetical protein